MSKEKDLLKAILANTKAIMEHLKISPAAPVKKAAVKKAKALPKAKSPEKKK